ncbi:hypothetical protein B0H11DRAFT_212931 [Mycena galericulata]|nr:hypothetical protein B0H11DRAFT_212931 [Mycena galericulata]
MDTDSSRSSYAGAGYDYTAYPHAHALEGGGGGGGLSLDRFEPQRRYLEHPHPHQNQKPMQLESGYALDPALTRLHFDPALGPESQGPAIHSPVPHHPPSHLLHPPFHPRAHEGRSIDIDPALDADAGSSVTSGSASVSSGEGSVGPDSAVEGVYPLFRHPRQQTSLHSHSQGNDYSHRGSPACFELPPSSSHVDPTWGYVGEECRPQSAGGMHNAYAHPYPYPQQLQLDGAYDADQYQHAQAYHENGRMGMEEQGFAFHPSFSGTPEYAFQLDMHRTTHATSALRGWVAPGPAEPMRVGGEGAWRGGGEGGLCVVIPNSPDPALLSATESSGDSAAPSPLRSPSPSSESVNGGIPEAAGVVMGAGVALPLLRSLLVPATAAPIGRALSSGELRKGCLVGEGGLGVSAGGRRRGKTVSGVPGGV